MSTDNVQARRASSIASAASIASPISAGSTVSTCLGQTSMVRDYLELLEEIRCRSSSATPSSESDASSQVPQHQPSSPSPENQNSTPLAEETSGDISEPSSDPSTSGSESGPVSSRLRQHTLDASSEFSARVLKAKRKDDSYDTTNVAIDEAERPAKRIKTSHRAGKPSSAKYGHAESAKGAECGTCGFSPSYILCLVNKAQKWVTKDDTLLDKMLDTSVELSQDQKGAVMLRLYLGSIYGHLTKEKLEDM